MNHLAKRPRLVVVSQVYPPDSAALGHYVDDAALTLRRRGWEVLVYTSREGYEDSSKRFPRCENKEGVCIRRLRFSSFGKQSLRSRIIGHLSFLMQASVRIIFGPRVDALLLTTSPPISSAAACLIKLFRPSVKIHFWLMDLNPDQAVALGQLSPNSVFVRALNTCNRWLYGLADNIVVMDKYMAERIPKDESGKVSVLPPWPREDVLEEVPMAENAFRARLGPPENLILLYAGNITPASPVDTILHAARQLRDRKDISFVFLGGGLDKPKVQAFKDMNGLENILVLPYEPLQTLKYPLSAADVHLVTLGDNMVGIIHPCKIYAAMAVGRPLIFVGPNASHVSDILRAAACGWSVAHADVRRLVEIIQNCALMDRRELSAVGKAGQAYAASSLSRKELLQRFCNIVAG